MRVLWYTYFCARFAVIGIFSCALFLALSAHSVWNLQNDAEWHRGCRASTALRHAGSNVLRCLPAAVVYAGVSGASCRVPCPATPARPSPSPAASPRQLWRCRRQRTCASHDAGVRGEAVAAPDVDAALPSPTRTSRWMFAGHDLRMQSVAGRSCWPTDWRPSGPYCQSAGPEWWRHGQSASAVCERTEDIR